MECVTESSIEIKCEENEDKRGEQRKIEKKLTEMKLIGLQEKH